MGVQHIVFFCSQILKKRGDDIYDCVYIKSNIERHLGRQTNQNHKYVDNVK